jgi:hypothetical protein
MLTPMNSLFHSGLLTGFTIAVAFLADVPLAAARMALVTRPRIASALDLETCQCDDSPS